MATEKYCKLIDEVCALAKIPNPRSFYETTDLVVDHVPFTLVEVADYRGQHVIAAYCDFGPVPGFNRAAVLERLMLKNLENHASDPDMATYTYNPESVRVLLGLVYPIEGMSAIKLMNELAKRAANAQEWRRTYFLIEEEKRRSPGRPKSNNPELFMRKFGRK